MNKAVETFRGRVKLFFSIMGAIVVFTAAFFVWSGQIGDFYLTLATLLPSKNPKLIVASTETLAAANNMRILHSDEALILKKERPTANGAPNQKSVIHFPGTDYSFETKGDLAVAYTAPDPKVTTFYSSEFDSSLVKIFQNSFPENVSGKISEVVKSQVKKAKTQKEKCL